MPGGVGGKWCAAALVIGLGSAVGHAATMTIDSLDGDITTNEINSFITYMATQSPPTTNLGNNMADGLPGTDVEAMGYLYEVTHNMTILNQMVLWSDTIMAYRNDQPLGEHRVMWDGRIEPVWPSKDLTSTEPGYAACENADVAGHVARCAQLILSNPSLWNQTIPDHNPHGFGQTYKQRALKWISMLDAGMSAYYTKWFVNSATNKFQTPTDPRWVNNAANETCTAWNRQMMFLNGYQMLAKCHDLLGDNPAFLSQYKRIIKTSANGLASSAFAYTSQGFTVYNWNYDGTASSSTDSPEEVFGVHGEYDMWGLVRAYNAGYTTVSLTQMTNFANSVQYSIYLGPDSFSAYVNGTSTTAEPAGTYVRPGWIFLSQFNRTSFKEIAQSQIDAGKLKTWPFMDASVLYMKHYLYTH